MATRAPGRGPAAAPPDRLDWGTTTVEAVVRGFPGRLYEPRRRSLAELLLDARRWSERTYLIQGDRRLTYAQVRDLVSQYMGALSRRGVGLYSCLVVL